MSAHNKYNAKATVIDGHRFDSKAEAARYQELRLLEMAGEIENLELQPKFELQPTFRNAAGETVRGITYKADFRYKRCDDGAVIVEDVKGFRTRDYAIKAKLLQWTHRDIIFVEYHH